MLNFFFFTLVGVGIFWLCFTLKWLDIRAAAITSAIFFVVSIAGYAISYHNLTTDVEILNGEVTAKAPWKFMCPTNTSNPCRNGYDCNCKTVRYQCGTSDKGRTQYCTRRECDTCYKYPWEQNWYVSSNLFDRMEISRVDRQGADTPPRWLQVAIGDPVSTTHNYTNWVMAAHKSLVHSDSKAHALALQSLVPNYPQIFDYYKINRVFTINYKLDNVDEWNRKLSEILRKLGPQKQANINIFMYSDLDAEFAQVVKDVWKGLKKNDIVIFMDYDKEAAVRDIKIMSWAKDDIFNVSLRSELIDRYIGANKINVDEFMGIVETNTMKTFLRRPMSEFEYLKNDIDVSNLVYYISVFALLLLLGIGVYLNRNQKLGYTNNNQFNYNRRFK